MSKILSMLWSRIRRTRRVALLLDYERRFKEQVVQRHGLPWGLPVIDLLELVPELDEEVDPLSFIGGSASPLEMAMLRGLARRTPACHYLEIGTFRGESVANVAGVAHKAVTVALSPSEMRAAGYSEEMIGVHGFFSRALPEVVHIQQDSRLFDFSTLGCRFDLVFVDGDHAPESVAADTRTAFSLLKDEGSAIVWHDYLQPNAEVRWSVLAGILAGCPEEERSRLYHVSHTHSAIFSKRRFDSLHEVPRVTPVGAFSLRVTARPLAPGEGGMRSDAGAS